jgi:hypothetical protein
MTYSDKPMARQAKKMVTPVTFGKADIDHSTGKAD